jgi:hypothetical protein
MIAWYNGGHLPLTLHVRKGDVDSSTFVQLQDIDEIVNVVETVQCNDWYYWTNEGSQGPFTHAQMSVWHKHGYLDAALLVKRGEGEEGIMSVEYFLPLSNYIGSDF